MKIDIVIAEPRELIRLGIEAAAGQTNDIVVTGRAVNARQALHVLRRLRPNLCIVAVDLPREGGLGLVASALRSGISTRIVMLGERCLEDEVFQAIEAGASGFVSKRESAASLCDFLRQASHGKQVLSSTAREALFRRIHHQRNDTPMPHLTNREFEVLRCAAEGLSINETARRLHVSVATVKNYRQHIFAHLGVSNVPAAIYTATRKGILR